MPMADILFPAYSRILQPDGHCRPHVARRIRYEFKWNSEELCSLPGNTRTGTVFPFRIKDMASFFLCNLARKDMLLLRKPVRIQYDRLPVGHIDLAGVQSYRRYVLPHQPFS